jgi:hypothetical protein
LGAGPLASRVPQDIGATNQLEGDQTMYMNQLTIIGFTGQDADFHYTQNGTPVTPLFDRRHIDNRYRNTISLTHG